MNRAWRGLAGGSAVAVAVIMVLSPAGLAGALPGATATYSLTVGAGGCGHVSAATPTFSAKTGVSHWKGTATVPCATKGIGGVGATNYAQASFGQTVFIPVKLTSNNSGANLTVSLVGTWAEAITGTLGTTCPMTSSYNYSYYATYLTPPTWINTTDTYGSCALEASVTVSGYPYIIDETTGTYLYPSYTNYWSGFNEVNEQTASSSVYTTHYSNPAWWSSNYTSYYSSGYIRGSNAAGTFASNPNGAHTWWWNYSSIYPYTPFSSTDSYVFELNINAEAYASTTGARHGTAMASINLAAPSNGIAYADATY